MLCTFNLKYNCYHTYMDTVRFAFHEISRNHILFKYLLCGGSRPTPQGRARFDRRADRPVSPGAAQRPPHPGLTTLGGRLLTLTTPCSEQQDRWSRRAAGLWVGRPQGFEPLRASVTELRLHMAAPRTCLGAGDHLGLDPHLQQSGNVRRGKRR